MKTLRLTVDVSANRPSFLFCFWLFFVCDFLIINNPLRHFYALLQSLAVLCANRWNFKISKQLRPAAKKMLRPNSIVEIIIKATCFFEKIPKTVYLHFTLNRKVQNFGNFLLIINPVRYLYALLQSFAVPCGPLRSFVVLCGI